MHILVIDDSTEHLVVIQDILSTEGYRVTTASSAFKGLEHLENTNFSLVITDLNIPILDGKHLIKIIKDKYPNTPVIVLSAFIEDTEELLELGAYAVHSKPPNISKLVSSIENAINDMSNSISFIFTHTDLKKIQSNIITRVIQIALRKTKGNQVQAAKMLGISRQSLIRYIKKYELLSPK